jgi:hypothetical protein
MKIKKILLIVLAMSYTAASQAVDSQLIINPAASSISSGVTVDGTVSVSSILGSDSLDVFDSQTLSGSASGNIDTRLNGNLVFTDLEAQAEPTGTLSDSGTLLGFPVSASVTVDSIKFDYEGQSQPFPLAATAMPDTRDFGPGSLPMLITIGVTVDVQIAGQAVTNLPDSFSGTVSIPVSGKVTVDMDGLPNRFIISIIGDPKSYSFSDSGTVSGANYSVDGLVTVEDFILDLGGTSTETGTNTPVDLSGTIQTSDGMDICAMVLASGKFMFSCNPIGDFSLSNLPRENNATVKRQIYADGFFPKIDILTGSSNDTVVMTRSGTCPKYNTPYDPGFFPNSAGKRINISGKVLLQDSQTSVCAMVLANGKYLFSCDGTGSYALNIPLDSKGQFKLQVYADGFAPTIQTFDEFQAINDVRMARAVQCQ